MSTSSRFASREKGTGLDNIVFSIHHNGNTETCASVPFDLQAFHSALANMDSCQDMDKYEIESFLTRFLAKTMQSNDCSPPDDDDDGFLSFCDLGYEHTPNLLDHNELVRVPETVLPRRFHTREGVRVASFEHPAELARDAQKCSGDQGTCQDGRIELHQYAVPAGRVFMFAPHHVARFSTCRMCPQRAACPFRSK